MHCIKNQKGFTTYQVLLIMPFVLFFAAIFFTTAERAVVKYVTDKAAKESVRVLTAAKNTNLARDMAARNIQQALATNINIPGTSQKPFNSSDDVYLHDDGTNCTAKVTYRMITPMPGMAKLFNPSAKFMDRYITVKSEVKGHREFDIPEKKEAP